MHRYQIIFSNFHTVTRGYWFVSKTGIRAESGTWKKRNTDEESTNFDKG